MSVLYIQVSSQVGADSGSLIFGALTYTATGVIDQPTQYGIYDYGASNNSAATPRPIFIGDNDARSYFDSTCASSLMATANASVSAGYYTSYIIEPVSAPVYADLSALATVATSGSYTDLANKPSIPAAQVNADWNASSGIAQISNKPSLATVATSGAYSDLSGKPTIPTVPTTVSSFTNDAGYLTAVPAKSFNNAPSHPIQTVAAAANGFQISSARDTLVSYSVSTSTTANIGGSSSASIYLEICSTNSATAANWAAIAEVQNSQAITLALALQSVQTIGTVLSAIVPAGYYARLRSSGSGTYSASYIAGQEVMI